jgi:flavin reductase (DIM6/NTAB) family NADH-FMN oxidoreductase RutF
MFVPAAGLDRDATYRFLNGAVVPRPIAWIASGASPKPLNLAPFSAFAWVAQHPPMVGFTANLRGGARKDTVRNIHEDGQFVVHIAGESLLEQLHASSEFMDAAVSEADALGLAVAPSELIDVPHLVDAPIAMECRHERTLEFGDNGDEFIVGRVVGWHVADALLDGQRIVSERLRPIARLGGPKYAALGDVVERAPFAG